MKYIEVYIDILLRNANNLLQEINRKGICLFVDGTDAVTVINDKTGFDIQLIFTQNIKVFGRLCRSNTFLNLDRIYIYLL